MKYGPHTVVVTQRPNCRRLILRYQPANGTFTLSVPKRTPQRTIRAFLDAQSPWMAQQAARPAPWTPTYAPGERHCLLGQWVTLGQDVPSGDAYLRHQQRILLDALQRLLARWTPFLGVTVTHVTLREMSSRWGSCRPATGRLTFNTKLVHYPEPLIEETVVHELCHFFHANHSAAFYREMDKHLPDWRTRKAARAKLDVQPRQAP